MVVDPATQALDATSTAEVRATRWPATSSRDERRYPIGSSAAEGTDDRVARRIDIGGTFTDAALVDGETGEVRADKVPTDAGRPARDS